MDRRHRHGVDPAGEHVADVGVLDSHYRTYVACVRLGGFRAAERLEGVELLDGRLIAGAVVLDDENAVAAMRSVPEKIRPIPIRPTKLE
jgi:hypothetical protein